MHCSVFLQNGVFLLHLPVNVDAVGHIVVVAACAIDLGEYDAVMTMIIVQALTSAQ